MFYRVFHRVNFVVTMVHKMINVSSFCGYKYIV